MGFYELVRTASKQCKTPARVITNIWTIFSKLLETCCATDHKLLMMELTDGLQKELEQMQKDCSQKLNASNELEGILRQNILVQTNHIDDLTAKLAEQKLQIEINNKHINTLGKAAEAQNAIRIKIEKRLNEMNTNKRKDEFVVHELKQ